MSKASIHSDLLAIGFVLISLSLCPQHSQAQGISPDASAIERAMQSEFSSLMDRPYTPHSPTDPDQSTGPVENPGNGTTPVITDPPDQPVVGIDPSTPEASAILLKEAQTSANKNLLSLKLRSDRLSNADLSNQLATRSMNQGNSSTCLTFATTTALDAAFFRQTQSKWNLSPMWLLRMTLGANILLNKDHSNERYYLGVEPEEAVYNIQKLGICSDDDFPYDPNIANNFESGYAGSNPDKNYQNILLDFASDFYVRPNSKLNQCLSTATSTTTIANHLHVFDVGTQDLFANLQILVLGIPIQAGLYNSNALRGGAHAITLIGFDLRGQQFYVRNSWGSNISLNLLDFSDIQPRNSSVDETISNMKIILSDNDIQRICSMPTGDLQKLPAVLLGRCAK